MAKKKLVKGRSTRIFQKSIKEKVSDPQVRGLVYYEIGKSF